MSIAALSGAVLLLVALALALHFYANRPPPKPPHPLAIAASEVASAALDGAQIAPGTPGFAVAAALPSRLAVTPALAVPVSWAAPQTLRLALKDGTTLWAQLMRDDDKVAVRVNADPPSARSRAIRGLRLKAWMLPADSLAAIPGFDGNFGATRKPTNLSTRTKVER